MVRFYTYKATKRGIILTNNQRQSPPTSFYTLSSEFNKGERITFDPFRNKNVLLVNTASDCVYTSQYGELQKLQEQFSDKLVILAFPSNDFGEQEKGNDQEIADFCQLNYGVDFTVMKKSSVVKGAGQHEVYQWLTDASKNGWNKQQPIWNFCKYLVDEQGVLTHFFGPAVSATHISRYIS